MAKTYKIVSATYKSGGTTTILMRPRALSSERNQKGSSPYSSLKVVKTIPATKTAIKKWRGY